MAMTPVVAAIVAVWRALVHGGEERVLRVELMPILGLDNSYRMHVTFADRDAA
jgi:hypothetical protein